MRWDAEDARLTSAQRGRRSRVVLTPQWQVSFSTATRKRFAKTVTNKPSLAGESTK